MSNQVHRWFAGGPWATFWGKKPSCFDLAYLFQSWVCHLVTPPSAMWEFTQSTLVLVLAGLNIHGNKIFHRSIYTIVLPHAMPRAIANSHKSGKSPAKKKKERKKSLNNAVDTLRNRQLSGNSRRIFSCVGSFCFNIQNFIFKCYDVCGQQFHCQALILEKWKHVSPKRLVQECLHQICL